MFVWGTRRPPVDRVRPVAKPMAAGWADRLWLVNLPSDAQPCPLYLPGFWVSSGMILVLPLFSVMYIFLISVPLCV